MGIVRTGESEYDKELRKWDLPKREGGMNANGMEPYPVMLYKAVERENGKVVCGDPLDEQFTARCQTIVFSPSEEQRAREQGWRESPKAALAHHEAIQQEIAQAAAEAAHAAQRMSEKARTERKGREDATHRHVTE